MAWSWSHTHKAYAYAQEQVSRLPRVRVSGRMSHGTLWTGGVTMRWAVQLAGRLIVAGCLIAGWIVAIVLYLRIMDYLLTAR